MASLFVELSWQNDPATGRGHTARRIAAPHCIVNAVSGLRGIRGRDHHPAGKASPATGIHRSVTVGLESPGPSLPDTISRGVDSTGHVNTCHRSRSGPMLTRRPAVTRTHDDELAARQGLSHYDELGSHDKRAHRVPETTA